MKALMQRPNSIAILLALLALGSVSSAQDEGGERIVDESAIPEGYFLFEGDILLPEGQTAATYSTAQWPNGVVPYAFDTDPASAGFVSLTDRSLMVAAMAAWEGVANVDFRPRNGDGNYLFIFTVGGNVSWSEGVGMAGGQHDIAISCFGCWGTVVHELGHALAYWHEQSRADRGTACGGNPCIQINSANIEPNGLSQFATRGSGGEYGPYDFDSIMHYNQCEFSVCSACPNTPPATCGNGGRSITVLPPNDVQWQNVIGQRGHLSTWDALVMSFLYPEDDWRFLDDQCGDRGWTCRFLPFFTCHQLGTFGCPYVDDFPDAVDQTPEGGTLWILSDGTSYSTGGTLSKPMTISAPLGATLTR